MNPARIIAELLSNQQYKCANRLDQPAIGLKNYKCPMWLLYHGNFDESSYEKDHIVEVCKDGNNDMDNIQVLCPACHAVKTSRFMKQPKPDI
jgi:hypothetical protein